MAEETTDESPEEAKPKKTRKKAAKKTSTRRRTFHPAESRKIRQATAERSAAG